MAPNILEETDKRYGVLRPDDLNSGLSPHNSVFHSNYLVTSCHLLRVDIQTFFQTPISINFDFHARGY